MSDAARVERAPAGGLGVGYRLGAMVLELALIGVVWWILRWPLPLVGAAAAVVVVSNLVPERWGTLTLGVCLIGVALFLWLYEGWQRIPLVIGVFGVVALAVGGLEMYGRRKLRERRGGRAE